MLSQQLTRLKDITGRATVPQIFLEGKLIGGCDDLLALDASGALAALPPPSQPPVPAHIQAILGQPRSTASTRLPLPLPSGFDRDEYERLEALADRLAGPQNPLLPKQTLEIPGRGGFLFLGGTGSRAEPGCFSGRALVDALVASDPSLKSDRPAALALARRMQDAGLLAFPEDLLSGGPPIADVDTDTPAAPRYRLRADAPPPRLNTPLNAHFRWPGAPRSAAVVADELRKRILRLYGEFLSSDGRDVDYEAMALSREFRDYRDATAELQTASFAGLSREDRIALFINLYNALIVHATVSFGAPEGTAGRLAFFRGARYVLSGQVFTSQDIEDGVLRGNRPGAAALGVLLGQPWLSKGPFHGEDPRRALVCDPMDPRIHFALVCGAKSCPAIRVFNASNLEAGLKGAAEAFCESEVDVDVAGKTVTLSKIFGWYKMDFGATEAERLERITGYMAVGPAREGLAQLAAMARRGEGVRVQYKHYDWTSNAKKK